RSNTTPRSQAARGVDEGGDAPPGSLRRATRLLPPTSTTPATDASTPERRASSRPARPTLLLPDAKKPHHPPQTIASILRCGDGRNARSARRNDPPPFRLVRRRRRACEND